MRVKTKVVKIRINWYFCVSFDFLCFLRLQSVEVRVRNYKPNHDTTPDSYLVPTFALAIAPNILTQLLGYGLVHFSQFLNNRCLGPHLLMSIGVGVGVGVGVGLGLGLGLGDAYCPICLMPISDCQQKHPKATLPPPLNSHPQPSTVTPPSTVIPHQTTKGKKMSSIARENSTKGCPWAPQTTGLNYFTTRTRTRTQIVTRLRIL